MSKRHLKKVVPPSKKKTHKKNLPKSLPEFEQEEEKTGPPKKKTSLKLQYPKGKAELGELSSEPQKSKKVLLSIYLWHNSLYYLIIGNKT